MAASGSWQRDILRALGARPTAENIRFLNAWQRAEGGGATFNPFNTTQPAPGATSYNSVGVRNYPSYQAGIKATVDTLLNGRYGHIVSGLRSGRASATQLAQAVENSPWGTGGLVLKVLGAGGVPATAPAGSGMPAQDRSVPTERPVSHDMPAPSPHAYSDFARGLIQASKAHSPEAMLGAIMQLRQAISQKQPVSSPAYGQPVPKKTASSHEAPGLSPQSSFPGGNPLQEMLAAQKLAKSMGLRVSENYDLPGGVHPVHVHGSYHYQRYKGGKVGRATDVSGSPAAMAAYYRRLAKTNPTELFYDPLGGIKYGKQIGAIGGHSDHVHIAY